MTAYVLLLAARLEAPSTPENESIDQNTFDGSVNASCVDEFIMKEKLDEKHPIAMDGEYFIRVANQTRALTSFAVPNLHHPNDHPILKTD